VQLVELQNRFEDLHAQRLGVAAISYDPPEILADFSRRRGITFPLLSDVGSATIRAFGILNTVAEEALGPDRSDSTLAADIATYVAVFGPRPRLVGTPFPGTFILDSQGRVTARFFQDFYRERNTTSSMMVRLGVGAAPVAGTKVSTEHLEITTYPSDAAVASGNHFALVFDIEPRPRMHVYAPGAEGYRIVRLSMEPQPFIRLLPLQYPASEIYFFEPLNERVPVYQQPFRLLQEVVLEGTSQAEKGLHGQETLTLNGTLEYQACDDKICFKPTSVALSWTVRLKPLDNERATPSR
jgi:peroxiredoxin